MIGLKVTNLDYTILGLLAGGGLSGYRIRKIFEDTALGSYSSSPGSIYPALKRLLKYGLVKKQIKSNTIQGLYLISGKGRDNLEKWLFQPITVNDVVRNSEVIVLRVAFMDVSDDRKQKLVLLESYRNAVKAHLKQLENFSPKEKESMYASGRFAFELGMQSCRLTLNWVIKILSIYRKNI